MNNNLKFSRPIFLDSTNKLIGWQHIDITDFDYFDASSIKRDEVWIYNEYISKSEPVHYGDWEKCTGLSDKNGTLIYEGDIVEDDDTKDSQYIIIFESETARFRAQGINNKNDKRLIKRNIRVISNIHEAKE